MNKLMMYQEILTIGTKGRGTTEITSKINNAVAESNCEAGLCHLFIKHTSASLIICENADPSVRQDLETFMQRLVPDGDPMFLHNYEGPDDMPAHLRTILTQTSITIPVQGGQLGLGTWQGIYLWEHRLAGYQRKTVVTILS